MNSRSIQGLPLYVWMPEISEEAGCRPTLVSAKVNLFFWSEQWFFKNDILHACPRMNWYSSLKLYKVRTDKTGAKILKTIIKPNVSYQICQMCYSKSDDNLLHCRRKYALQLAVNVLYNIKTSKTVKLNTHHIFLTTFRQTCPTFKKPLTRHQITSVCL